MKPAARIHAIGATSLPETFRLGVMRVDLNANLITRAGHDHRITPKAAAVMGRLASVPARAVTRDELLRDVWGDAFPTDDVLSHAITELRRALGDDARNSRFIETIPKVGYRLLVEPEPLLPDSRVEKPTRARLKLVLGFAAGVGLGVAATVTLMRSEPIAGPDSRADALAGSFPVSARPGPESMPAMAPDGRRVAFVSAPAAGEPTDILVKSIAGGVSRNVTQTRGVFEYSPSWSPDGASLAFLRFADGECRIVIRGVEGGLERDVGACIGDAITYVDWSPDGQRLAISLGDPEAGVSRIQLVNLETGETRPLEYSTSREHDVQPKFSPDGSRLAFRRGVNPRSELMVVDVAGGAALPLTGLGSRIFGFDWLPDSSKIWFCAQPDGMPSLFEVNASGTGLARISGRCAFGLSMAANARTLAFEDHAGDANLIEVALAGAEPSITPVFVSTRTEREAVFSPDGGKLVFVSDRTGEDQLWIGNRETGEALQLTRLAGLGLAAPRFRHDGETVVFVGRGAGREALYEVNLRSGIVVRISEPADRVRGGVVGRDGARYLVSDRSGDWQIWRVGPEGGAPRQLTGQGGHRPLLPGDGYLYFTRLDRYGVWRVPVAGGAEEWVSDLVHFAAHEAWFVRDGWLYTPYFDNDETVRIIRARVDDPDQQETLLTLAAGESGMLSDVAPDGRVLLLTQVSAGREDIAAVVGY